MFPSPTSYAPLHLQPCHHRLLVPTPSQTKTLITPTLRLKGLVNDKFYTQSISGAVLTLFIDKAKIVDVFILSDLRLH